MYSAVGGGVKNASVFPITSSTQPAMRRAGSAPGRCPLDGSQSSPHSKSRTTRSLLIEARWRSHAWKTVWSIPLTCYTLFGSGRLMQPVPVGILGATGMVGQQFIALLAHHPWFRVTWLGASQRSEGKAYRDATAWRLSTPLPDDVARLGVEAATPGRAPKLVFSGLDSSVAG